MSEASVESICKSVGFGNFSYFYRKFNEKYNCTPRKARKDKKQFADGVQTEQL